MPLNIGEILKKHSGEFVPAGLCPTGEVSFSLFSTLLVFFFFAPGVSFLFLFWGRWSAFFLSSPSPTPHKRAAVALNPGSSRIGRVARCKKAARVQRSGCESAGENFWGRARKRPRPKVFGGNTMLPLNAASVCGRATGRLQAPRKEGASPRMWELRRGRSLEQSSGPRALGPRNCRKHPRPDYTFPGRLHAGAWRFDEAWRRAIGRSLLADA